MIDINTYRSRIGLFSPKSYRKKFLRKCEYYKQFDIMKISQAKLYYQYYNLSSN